MAIGSGRVAKRYAKSLQELCEVKDLDQMLAALSSFAKVWQSNSEIRSALTNPSLPISQREEVLRDLATVIKKGDASFANFLSLLLINHRLELIGEIEHSFARLINEIKGMLALEISSAFPLSENEQAELEQGIKRDFGGMATVKWSVRKEILGGLLIKSGDRELDSSIKGRLHRIRAELVA